MTDDATIVNRRGFDPDDSERLSRRGSIREAAGKRDVELLPAILGEADIAASELRVDVAADEHAVATGPLQVELSTLEAAAVQRIADRQPANAEADERRAELVAAIAEATTELEAVVAAEKKIQAVLRAKVQYIRQGHLPPDTILAALARPPAANPRLLTQQHVCHERIKWLQARHRAAEKALGICRYNLAEIKAGRMAGDLGFFVGKTASWQAELDGAASELAGAIAEGKRVQREILDE